MSTHNIGFYKDFDKNYLSIIIKYYQIHTVSLPLFVQKLKIFLGTCMLLASVINVSSNVCA